MEDLLHDFAQALALAHLHDKPDHFCKFDRFRRDVEDGSLPNYSFIEPRYFDFPGSPPANDQHPPHDLCQGELLIAEVFDTIRSSHRFWPRSLLVVTYEEHGGFYDHVPPLEAIEPDGIHSNAPAFAFDRLGVRVPAVLVSPWLPRNAVDSTVYDHTSILAAVRDTFGLGRSLTKRDARAATFRHLLLDEARDDALREVRTRAHPTEAQVAPVSSRRRRCPDTNRAWCSLRPCSTFATSTTRRDT